MIIYDLEVEETEWMERKSLKSLEQLIRRFLTRLSKVKRGRGHGVGLDFWTVKTEPHSRCRGVSRIEFEIL